MSERFRPVTLQEFEEDYREFHLLWRGLEHWASVKPDALAVINATRGTGLSWLEFRNRSNATAAALARMGFRAGDFLATSLPLSDDHIVLEFACFRLGVIHAPLDLRLSPADVIRSIQQIQARGYAHPGKLGPADFQALADAVKRSCPSVEHIIREIPAGEGTFESLEDAGAGAQVIFTTGSTGSPKPALLSHRGIACQNLGLARAFNFSPGQRVLVNLPASHVGGQAELLLTTLMSGATAVTLEIFDPALSLRAIEEHKVTLLGQIPAMFQMEWRSSEFGKRDLSSLQTVVYGGQSVARPFLERMLQMGPTIGTGLGLTEASGFCTYVVSNQADELENGLGVAMPVYPMSIRGSMEHDGTAGPELPRGEIGQVCFRGPQNFLGYVNDPDATAGALSKDGWMYTGDMGSIDESGLHFSGRAKWILKPAGYQVFPGDIENHISSLSDKVASVGVVGHPHDLWSEGIIAFVERRPDVDLSETELRRHARGLASYMRPLHYVILEQGEMALNRSAKVDMLKLGERAREEVRKLRERGRWDGELADSAENA